MPQNKYPHEIRLRCTEKEYKLAEQLMIESGHTTMKKGIFHILSDYLAMRDKHVFMKAENEQLARINSSLLDIVSIKKKQEDKKKGH